MIIDMTLPLSTDTRDALIDSCSLCHHEVYGYYASTDQWAVLDDKALIEATVVLGQMNDRSVDEENQRNARRLASWKTHIADLMLAHGIDRATAIRWDMQAMGESDDFSHYVYLCGVEDEFAAKAFRMGA